MTTQLQRESGPTNADIPSDATERGSAHAIGEREAPRFELPFPLTRPLATLSPGERDGVRGRRLCEASDDLSRASLSGRGFGRCTTLIRAFTLIEIMVVIIIIGILAATIIPQFMGTTHDAKVSKAKSDVSELENALERFYIHMDRHPTTEEGLKVLVTAPPGDEGKWRGPYVKQLRDDPWGHPYQYRYPGTHHPTSFDLWSRAADGVDGGEKEGADIGNW